MLLGAIDIGSNAMRFLVASAMEHEGHWQFERVEYLRYPIRLGADVFTKKKISEEKEEKLMKMLSAFKAMFEVFEVQAFQACATSAMRDAENGKKIVARIEKELQFEVEIVSGEKEAKLTEKAIHRFLQKGNYIHIDVGGGSTEVSFISDFEKIASHSFDVGTVRAIHHGISDKNWLEIQQWVEKHKIKDLSGIGTGGNIKRLHELSEVRPESPMNLSKLENLLQTIEAMSIRDRTQKFKLNQDRADVIVPAALIFAKILHWADASTIFAPNAGLIDGIVVNLWEMIVKD